MMPTAMQATDLAKKAAGHAAAELVESGMRVGFGTGSTFVHVLDRLQQRVRDEGLDVIGVPTSEATARRARELGLPLGDLESIDALDLAIDGADEVDGAKVLIKGGGGALVREKIVAAAADELVVVVSANKVVERLGSTFALPVEVMPFGWRQAARAIARLGVEAVLRNAEHGVPARTDNDNYVLDCKFKHITEPAELERTLNAIPGVIDNGLFVGMAGRVLVGETDGTVRRW